MKKQKHAAYRVNSKLSIFMPLKGILALILSLFIAGRVMAQSAYPVCSGTGAGVGTGGNASGSGLLYFLSGGIVYRMNPNAGGIPASTGIILPAGSTALAVSANLNGGAITPTYYTTAVIGSVKYLHYNDGGAWVNTGYILDASHIAGGGGYIFGLDTSNGNVYRSNGVSAPIMITNVSNASSGSRDLSADCAGNFYVINQLAGTFKKYNANGSLQYTYTLSGANGVAGGGLAVNGNKVYYDGADGKLYTGYISAGTVNFSASASTVFANLPVDDMGNCGGYGVNGVVAATDTIRVCTNNNQINAVTLNAPAGGSAYNWRLYSGGPATINNFGSTAVVYTANIAVILHDDPNCSGVGVLVDTTVIITNSVIANLFAAPLYPMAGQKMQTIFLNFPLSKQTDTIKVAASGGAAPYTYSWTVSGCNNATQGAPFSTQVSYTVFSPAPANICAANSGDNIYTYAVTVTDKNGCQTTATRKLNVVDPYVGDQVRICHKTQTRTGTSQQLIVTTYSDAVNNHLPHNDALGNCAAFTGRMAGDEAPAAQALEIADIRVYPNPSMGNFIVELPGGVQDGAQIIVTDIQGKVIARQQLEKDGASKASFELGNLSKGMYLITVKDGELLQHAKITMQ